MLTRSGYIDVHAHFVTDTYIAKARAAGQEQPDGVPGWPTWSPKAHLELMDQSGIDTAFLSVSSPGIFFGDAAAARDLAREVNESGAEAVRDHPGRFGLFASLPLPDVDGALKEISYAFDTLGADGVVLMTNTHGLYLGNEKLEPVFAELERREAVVFLHPTSPVCWEQSALGRPSPMIEFVFDTARTVTDMLFAGVLERHPRLPVIVPHSGGALPVVADRIDGFMRDFPSAIGTEAVDVVTQLGRLYYDTAGSAFPRQIPALLNLVKPEQLLYGSDYCWTPAPAAYDHTRSFDSAAAPAEGVSWRTMTATNARRILPRLTR